MKELAYIFDYLDKSNAITIAVLVLLSIYFIIVNWVFFYRYIVLATWLSREKRSLETLKMGSKKPALSSYLHRCSFGAAFNEKTGDYCIFDATRASTKGLTLLSVAASTSPFIGLFGTVVSILETFYILGTTKASISSISASIGEALVATAAGILVAIFAYTYHLVLKRKAYEVVSYLKMEIDLVLSYR
jgi:flagellar motor component MotA